MTMKECMFLQMKMFAVVVIVYLIIYFIFFRNDPSMVNHRIVGYVLLGIGLIWYNKKIGTYKPRKRQVPIIKTCNNCVVKNYCRSDGVCDFWEGNNAE